MFTLPARLRRKALFAVCAFLLAACSPKFDWREVRGTSAPYVALMPAKPASHTRPVNLDGTSVSMTMTAAEVDGVTFAIGTAELPDEDKAKQAISAMKTALVRNIGGTVRKEMASAPGSMPATIDVDAAGTESRVLLGRFVASGKRVYQVIVVGKENALSREEADTFLTSFKPG